MFSTPCGSPVASGEEDMSEDMPAGGFAAHAVFIPDGDGAQVIKPFIFGSTEPQLLVSPQQPPTMKERLLRPSDGIWITCISPSKRSSKNQRNPHHFQNSPPGIGLPSGTLGFVKRWSGENGSIFPSPRKRMCLDLQPSTWMERMKEREMPQDHQ